MAKELLKPVAAKLASLVYAGVLYAPIEPGTSFVESAVFLDVWQDTMLCVWRNVRAGRFKEEGSLFTYVYRIALARWLDSLRKYQRFEKGIDREVDLEQIPASRAAQPEGQGIVALLHDIQVFCGDYLTEETQVIMMQHAILVLKNGPEPVRGKELAAAVARAFRERGWAVVSRRVIRFRYRAGRELLQHFLIERGYNVTD